MRPHVTRPRTRWPTLLWPLVHGRPHLRVHLRLTLRSRDDSRAARVAENVDRSAEHVEGSVDGQHGPDDQVPPVPAG